MSATSGPLLGRVGSLPARILPLGSLLGVGGTAGRRVERRRRRGVKGRGREREARERAVVRKRDAPKIREVMVLNVFNI